MRGVRPYDTYELSWFNPRTGEWLEDKVALEATHFGNVSLPPYPDELDWAFKLKKINTGFPIRSDDAASITAGDLSNAKTGYIQTDSKK